MSASTPKSKLNCEERTPESKPNGNEMPITSLVFSPAVYPRRHYSEERVEMFVDLLEAGTQLPPITVQRETGVVLAGVHRMKAYQRLERGSIPAVEVDVADEDLLTFAYQQDDMAALPYTLPDQQDVARRHYESGKNIATVAELVHRPRQTIERWLQREIAQATAYTERAQAVRAVVVQALSASGYSQREIAPLLGVSQATVNRDAQLSIANHLADANIDDDATDEPGKVVDDASGRLWDLRRNAQHAQVTARVEAAQQWLDAQVAAAPQPEPSPPEQDRGEENPDGNEDDGDDLDVDESGTPDGDSSTPSKPVRPRRARPLPPLAQRMKDTMERLGSDIEDIDGLLNDDDEPYTRAQAATWRTALRKHRTELVKIERRRLSPDALKKIARRRLSA
jgi:ParB-like chromosome segregation protein Spo0J